MRTVTALIATLFLLAIVVCAQDVNTAPPSRAQEQPRIYITDSQSWETRSSSGGTWGAWRSKIMVCFQSILPLPGHRCASRSPQLSCRR